MSRYSVAEARKQFSSLLDQAGEGRKVYIERRGERFCLIKEPKTDLSKTTHPKLFSYIDPVILQGDWEWSLDNEGELVLSNSPDES